MTSEDKARAWDEAARMIVRACKPRGRRVASDPVRVHLLTSVVPSLRQRAKIIRRNAPSR